MLPLPCTAPAGGTAVERDAAAAHCRTTLTIPAFNLAQAYHGRFGERLSKLGTRRLRHQTQREPGRSPVVIFMEDCYWKWRSRNCLPTRDFPRDRVCYPRPAGPTDLPVLPDGPIP